MTYDSPVMGLLGLNGLTREEETFPVCLGYVVEGELTKVETRVIGVSEWGNV